MPPAPIPDTQQTRRDMASYKASARVLDAGIGTLLRELETSGLAANTLVICTTDHGIPFPEMKCSLRDGGIGVMLMMRGPGGFSGGKVVDSMVSHIDLFPTICDVAGVAKPSWLQGRSLNPLIRGEVAKVRDEVFAEVNYHAAYEPKRAVRTERHKYIRHFDKRGKPVLPNCDDGLSKSLWLDAGWSTQPVPEEELYDLIFDPNETRNLAGDPKHRDAHKDMASRLDRWRRETDDPILKGPIPLPPGAKVNDVDGASPKEPVKG
jgi:N-sulfoglucosamine sulfohydrolase